MSVHASGVNYDYDRVIRVPLLLSCCPDARQKDGLRRVILPEGARAQ